MSSTFRLLVPAVRWSFAATRFLHCLTLGFVCLAGLTRSEPAIALTMTPTVAPSPTPCPDCVRLGSAEIRAPIVEPLFPRIGETVTLRFSSFCYSPFGCGIENYSFSSSGPLTGSSPPEFVGGFVVVQRVVVGAGTAYVNLSVTVATEEQCYAPSPDSSGCGVFFVRGTPISASSPETSVRLLDADEPYPPTPTPTITATPVPSRTATPTRTATSTPIVVALPVLDPLPARFDTCAPRLHGSAAGVHCGMDVTMFTRGVETNNMELDCATARFSFGIVLPPSRATRFDLCRSDNGSDPSCVEVAIEQRLLGDCGSDGEVTVDEILRAVAIALGEAEAADCRMSDRNEDGTVAVDEILAAIANALDGCR